MISRIIFAILMRWQVSRMIKISNRRLWVNLRKFRNHNNLISHCKCTLCQMIFTPGRARAMTSFVRAVLPPRHRVLAARSRTQILVKINVKKIRFLKKLRNSTSKSSINAARSTTNATAKSITNNQATSWCAWKIIMCPGGGRRYRERLISGFRMSISEIWM